MKQPHTEYGVRHTEDPQNTGNHRKRGTREERRAGRLGGMRAGARNVEPPAEARQKGETLDESGATPETEE